MKAPVLTTAEDVAVASQTGTVLDELEAELDPLVVFTPSGLRGRFGKGTTVLGAARSLGVDLDSVCGGRGICGRCQVTLGRGEFPKHGIVSQLEHLNGLTESERNTTCTTPLKEGRRLGCAAEIHGDVVIDVPPDSQVHRQVVRKRADSSHIEVRPNVRLYYVEVAEPDMHDPSGDLERLTDALSFEWELDQLECDLAVLQVLQGALRADGFRVTVAVHRNRELIAVWPGYRDRIYGMAVDVGSTTIAAHLCDLVSGKVLGSSGQMNPQIRFGEDLMSRVSYAMMNPGGEQDMTTAVRAALNDLSVAVADDAGVAVDEIVSIVLVGNPVMHHLLLGINPVELGGAPFALAIDGAKRVRAAELDLKLHPGARAYLLPCIAGHVGADCAAVLLSEAPYDQDAMTLVVDVGTNAEILLGNRRRMVACSSPTGPAFEGAQLSCGQRAAPGAIERVRINPETLEPRFSVIGSERWSDQPGFEEAVAQTGVTGICGSGIIEVIAEMYLSGVMDTDGVIRSEAADRSPHVVADGRTFSYRLRPATGDREALYVTQNDVRAIQLAKAALYAGVRLLMDALRIDKVERIRLAGAFGSHIDVKYAMVLGLVPDCALDQVSSAGNAAGTGALVALLDNTARGEIEDAVRRVQKVETAVEPRFQAHFVDAMAIPHKTAPNPELAKAVKLPERTLAGGGDASAPRRRRRRRA